MKKHFSWITALIIAVSVFLGISCSQEVETEVDKTAPKEVKNFTVTVKDNAFYLSWINPDDADFAGIQISMSPAEGILSNPISLGKTVTAFPISGLTVGKDYAFTVKTFDTSLNYSVGETVVKRIQSKDDPVNPVDPDKPNDPVDTTPPASVINLSAVYDAETLQITVSWKNPEDLDFAGTQLVYGKVSSADIKTLSFDKSYSQTVIQGIAADDSEYSFKIVAIDTVGNTSEVASTTVMAKNEKIVLPSDLRTGDYVLTDNTYVRKEYFSELTQEERAKIFGVVCITDSGEALILGTQFSTNESRWTASPAGINTYLANIATGVSGSEDYGYTFTGDLDGSDNWEYICSIDTLTQDATTVPSMYPAFYLANIYSSYAGLTGTDFADGWYLPTISELYQMYKNIDVIKSSLSKLGISLPYTYDDNLNDYTCRAFWSSSVPTAPGQTAYKLDYYTGEIENVDRGTYSNYVWAFHKFDKKFDSYAYPEAQITSVELPSKVGVGYEGTIPVTITGNNFYAYEITGDVYGVTYISNTQATGYVYNPRYAGSHNITVTCGNASGVGILNVVVAPDFSVGDILFTDGTKIKAENVQYGIPSDMISKAFGVVAGIKDYGSTPFVVGLQKGVAEWAPRGTTGYNKNFTGIQGTITSGDMDGSDNWEYICSIDPEGTKDSATKYPAFNYALSYGQTAELAGTEYADGWYIPSIAELKIIYDNRHILAESLSIVGGADALGDSYYWSSSQSSFNQRYACILSFDDGSVSDDYKDCHRNVLVIQTFNPKLFNNYEYPEVQITSVEIPTVSSGYEGVIPVTITGNNFDVYEIIGDVYDITYISNTKAIGYVANPGYVGSHNITVTCGNASAVGILNIVDVDYSVGDILFTDGTKIKAENVQYGIPSAQITKAFGVVIGTKCYGTLPFVVGVKKGNAIWAEGTIGFNKNFSGIQADVSGDKNSGYTFTGDLDGSDNWEYICSKDPEGTQDAATNYPAFNFVNTYGQTVDLIGTEYADGWYLPSIAEIKEVYENKHVLAESLSAIGGSDTLSGSYYWSSSQSLAFDDYVYIFDFDLGIVYDVSKSCSCSVLVVQTFNPERGYPEAQITSVEIPTVSSDYEGKIPITITGNNLYAYEITGDVYDISYISNTKATGYVTNPGYAGSHNITVACGNAVGIGILNVVDIDYSVGDVLFTDGTKIQAGNVQYGILSDMIPKALGIVAGFKDCGITPFVVGVKKGTSLQWAPRGETGYDTNFTEIQGTTTSGDMDGSDNWNYICSVDPTGSANAATNYPAFNFANTYGQTSRLTGTGYEDGWYLPSIAELKIIYDNRHILAESLSAVGGADTLGGSYYWSSSQSSSLYCDAYGLNFFDGSVYNDYKKDDYSVIVVQALTSKQFNNYEIGYTGTSIKDVKIASAGEGYTGELLVTIIGTNLKGQSITCSDSSFDNLTYQSNTVATATIDCDGVVGEKSISFYCGSSVVTQTAKVLSSTNCITSADIGKIVLSDGSFVSKDSFNSSTMTPIAVVVGLKYNGGQVLAVGLQKGYAMWAPSGTTGYTTIFTGIQGHVSIGDMDGSDNWAYICNEDPQATVYPATNYPAFNYANTYGITAGLIDTDYAEGWYLPSLAELDAVYDNKSTIQESLDVVGGFTIGTSEYLSSNLSLDSSYASVVRLCLGNGGVCGGGTEYNYNVLVVQAFNAQ